MHLFCVALLLRRGTVSRVSDHAGGLEEGTQHLNLFTSLVSMASIKTSLSFDSLPPLPSHGDLQDVETIIKKIPELQKFIYEVKSSLHELEIQSAGRAVAVKEKEGIKEEGVGKLEALFNGTLSFSDARPEGIQFSPDEKLQRESSWLWKI
ncbi:uncharacterized protein J3R85_008081 [Psidium guajava]|nr:uncharacterized protein J3R85_008081 [Psidium guajava]